MRKRIAGLLLATALCAALTVPALAANYTWNTDEAAQEMGERRLGNSDWDTRVKIDGIYDTEYVEYGNDDYGIVLYCTVPARVTVLEYVIDYGSPLFDPVVVTAAEPMDLGGSMVRYELGENDALIKKGEVEPTYQIPVYDEEMGWTSNGAGTYWDLDAGLYYMESVVGNHNLFLVVGDPFGEETVPSFSDVSTDSFCYEPVNWAVELGVTTGVTATTFCPTDPCTQAQILTFLWRAAGKPEPTIGNPYSSEAITADKYFYKALVWAWEEGLTDDSTLDPYTACQRASVVTYLWKLDGRPYAGTADFTDVSADAAYADAVAWAVDAGVTKGITATAFGPTVTCNRGQIVTFLWRYFVGE